VACPGAMVLGGSVGVRFWVGGVGVTGEVARRCGRGGGRGACERVWSCRGGGGGSGGVRGEG